MSDSERAQADAPVVVSLKTKANQTPSTVLEGVVELRRQASAAVVPSVHHRLRFEFRIFAGTIENLRSNLFCAVLNLVPETAIQK